MIFPWFKSTQTKADKTTNIDYRIKNIFINIHFDKEYDFNIHLLNTFADQCQEW